MNILTGSRHPSSAANRPVLSRCVLAFISFSFLTVIPRRTALHKSWKIYSILLDSTNKSNADARCQFRLIFPCNDPFRVDSSFLSHIKRLTWSEVTNGDARAGGLFKGHRLFVKQAVNFWSFLFSIQTLSWLPGAAQSIFGFRKKTTLNRLLASRVWVPDAPFDDQTSPNSEANFFLRTCFVQYNFRSLRGPTIVEGVAII